ncbi:MAG: MopE-related protein [Candidatus Altiarchaeota archaeon]|nr:MopE-related protein [Candidatus Altiarchaeota archaeon]
MAILLALVLAAGFAAADTMTVVSDTSVKIVGVYNKAGGPTNYVDLSSSPLNAVRAQEPKPYPTGYVSEPPEVTNSVWDMGVSWSFQTNAPTADWIWETERAEGPSSYDVSDPLYDAAAYTNGRVVVFEKKFTISGAPQSSSIRVTADNACEVWVNGNYIGRSSTAKVAGWELTNLKEASVATTGWQTVNNFAIPASALVSGENTLTILAANEYYFSDDGNTPSPALVPSPYAQYNPGAMIFNMEVNYTGCTPSTETCNGVDDDCDQQIDEDLTQECGGELCVGISTCTAGVWSACDSQGDLCRASAGECDVPEYCTRDAEPTCPNDGFVQAATECRAQTGVCDVAEMCTGSSAACPDDGKSTAVCRQSAGICDVAESCDGVTDDCPTDGFLPGTQECRGSAGVCDPAESCTGSSAECPADGKSTAVCRAKDGVCDVAEVCDGVNNGCPTDAVAGTDTSCRAISGTCDIVDFCDGLSTECGPDVYSDPASCYTGPGGTEGVGICHGGQKVCSFGAPHEWGTCDGEQLPETEICDGIDNNCNGAIDEMAECMVCTLTQGYWKTHSASGPAPYDENWMNASILQENTTFYLSGQTWLQVFRTPVQGNAYYQLAHQYMAAKLNVLMNWAPAPAEVTSAITQAEALFNTYTPAQIAALKGKSATAVKAQFQSLASTLGSYNEGTIGPGHCDDQEVLPPV